MTHALPGDAPSLQSTPSALVRYCGFSIAPVRLPVAARLMLQRRYAAGAALRTGIRA